jgi:hypothetical protein
MAKKLLSRQHTDQLWAHRTSYSMEIWIDYTFVLSPMLQKREQAPKCGSNEEEIIYLSFLTTCFDSLSHHQVSDFLLSPLFVF